MIKAISSKNYRVLLCAQPPLRATINVVFPGAAEEEEEEEVQAYRVRTISRARAHAEAVA